MPLADLSERTFGVDGRRNALREPYRDVRSSLAQHDPERLGLFELLDGRDPKANERTTVASAIDVDILLGLDFDREALSGAANAH